jgi:acetylornithine aminotransferase
MLDSRVAEAKRLLTDALADHSAALTDVQPAKSELKANYQLLLDRLGVARGGETYFPYIASGIGNGPYVELGDGSVKLDFIGGIGVHGLGHSHVSQMLASVDAALEDTVMQGNLQQNLPTLEMCERLLTMANTQGAELAHCLLTTSGAMANENSLKIALHNRAPAERIIALDGCFAGRSLALAQLTDKPAFRQGLPTTVTVDHIPTFCPSDPDGSINFTKARLEQLLKRWPNQHACLWLELVAGEGGYYPGSTEFFKAIIDVCREHDVLTIFDEVQTFSRLSQPYAFQHFGLDQYADIVTIGKISQVCATLYRGDLKPTAPILSQTFTGSTAAIRCGLALLDELESQGCWGTHSTNLSRHDYFAKQLADLAEKYPGKLSGPYGAGMMIGLTPGDGSPEVAKQMVLDLYEHGLMSFVAGGGPARVRFLPPPGITTHAHIDHACRILEQVIAK